MRKSVLQTNPASYLSNVFFIAIWTLVACGTNTPINNPPFDLTPTTIVTTAPSLATAESLDGLVDLIALGVDLDGEFSFGLDGDAEIMLFDIQAARQNPRNAQLMNLTDHPDAGLVARWSSNCVRVQS
jgi:hypothetical protein